MQRLSIARSLRLALIGLTVVLTVVAVLGVTSLLSARARYEHTLNESAALSIAAANLLSVGLVSAQVHATPPGKLAPTVRPAVAAAYASAVRTATALAASDPRSAALLSQQLAAERRLLGSPPSTTFAPTGPLQRSGLLAVQLQARQSERQANARARERSDSRRAVTVVIVSGALAVIAALALIAALIAWMRGPLDALVEATGELASGQFRRRVPVGGPRELRALGRSFNAMGEALVAAQARIEEERRRLATTIESLGDGLIVTDPGSTRIAAVNPRATELLPELGPGDAVDGPDSPLPPQDEALTTEQVIEHHGRFLAVTAAHIGSSDEGTVWTLRDMSERARLEQAKTDFVTMASHELRSPLTSIKGFIELLARSSDGFTDRQREFVDIISRSTERLVELVNDLLDVARIEADRVDIEVRPIDVGEAVHEIVELMRPRFEEKRQHLGVFVAPTMPLALADPGRVRQIIANLLTNAHLYTEEEGRIHIGVEGDRARVQLVVADSGVGLAPDEYELVFERFYRATESHATPGTGLGLSIVKALVDMQNGEIEVDSLPGRGTTFTVRLPAATPSLGSPAARESIRGQRVLVVDDEADAAELIAAQLAPLEVTAAVATNGREALRQLRAEEFDAVILDVLMPEMDGVQVLREIRADPELAAIPIVFVSVFSARSELSGEWFLPKPVDTDRLRDVLGAAVSSSRSRVLVVAREHLQPLLEPSLDELGIEHEWETTGAAAARVCGERRFEVALVDIGIRNPRAALQALHLRGRRLRRAVILFTDGQTETPEGIDALGMEVIPVSQAASALLAAIGVRRSASATPPGDPPPQVDSVRDVGTRG